MTPTLSHVGDDEFSNPLVKGEGLDSMNNQGAGQQDRPVREIIYGDYRHSPGPSSPKVERAAMKKVRKIRELQGQQSPQRQYHHIFNCPYRCPEISEQQDGKWIRPDNIPASLEAEKVGTE